MRRAGEAARRRGGRRPQRCGQGSQIAAAGESRVVEHIGDGAMPGGITQAEQVVGAPGLKLGADHAVPAGELEVVPLDRALGDPDAGDVDDDRRGAPGQRRREFVTEQVPAEVVEGERGFESFGRLDAPGCLPVREQSQSIDYRCRILNRGDGGSGPCDRAEVGTDEIDRSWHRRIREEPLAFGGLAANREYAVSPRRTGQDKRTPHSVRSAADHDGSPRGRLEGADRIGCHSGSPDAADWCIKRIAAALRNRPPLRKKAV
jgi:hypothetical protein